MTVLDDTTWLTSPAPLAVICATLALLGAHAINPTARIVMVRWALGALAFWLLGAALPGSWLREGPPFWSLHEAENLLSPAGGLIALLVWTLWYCRRRPELRQRLCALVMVAGGLWWGLEQWRLSLPSALSETLPMLTLESLEGRSVTLIRDSEAKNRKTQDNEVRYFLLWRSDCNACRQWLQQLAEQPLEHQDAMILVNQGESLLSVVRYLDHHPDQQLGLADTALLLDPQQRLLAASGGTRLPVLLHRAPDGTVTRLWSPSVLIASSLP
ncbi:hypothetical protein SAMN05421848_0739 [Kushneria avicenniae]|uniref:AhpC/TSA family protein n=1 Tax=Kushneria avicenniae TaxID=402385 RepID=A0A1I1HU99_9GAMM|nr:DUF998 domain-containing protein [Kushneria avicenniae]SFC24560.1 hypothetical protein SAMN05421848_0739 [Kushneria avicenniae]